MIIRPNCIIFSHPTDVHVGAVLDHFPSQSLPYIIDFGEFCRSYGATLSLGNSPALSLATSDGDIIELQDLKTVWWRRPQPIYSESASDPLTMQFVNEEYLRFWQSSLATLAALTEVRWYNPYKKNETADCKFRQLEIAKSVGLAIPETIVTNVYAQAKRFLEENKSRAIFKSFAGNEDFWQPTRIYKDEYEEYLKNNIGFCPVIFQKYIDGKFDYRVVVVDEEIFAVRFDLANSRYKYDVRIDTKNKASAISLDDKYKMKILEYMKVAGINYGAFDFREDENGELYFFEVNPAGQFLYLDHLAGTSISKAMADALGKISPPRHITRQTPEGEFFIKDRLPFAAAVPERIRHFG